MHHIRTIATAMLAGAALVACSSGDNSGAAGDSAAGMAAAPAAAPAPVSDSMAAPSAMSDANILAVVELVDSAEVGVARYVRTTSKNADVRSFAQELETDHAQNMSKSEGVAKQANITMQVPPSDTTKESAAHLMDRLKSLSGTDLDTAFVNSQVLDHQHVIQQTNAMITSAQNPQVKELLQNTLPALQKHLDRAQQLQTKLTTNKS